MTKAEWLASRDGPELLMRVSREQNTPRKDLLFACACLRCYAERNDDWSGFPGPLFFAPAGNLRDWLTGAEEAADGNTWMLDEYSSSMAGQKAIYSVSTETLALVVRDLFAYPFAPVPFHDDWLTTNVVALARTIDSGAVFEDMPILGDALEEASCADEDVLRHCRHESRHFRGCWVLDSLLRRGAGCWRDPCGEGDS
jgi:hypothetical protein